MVSLLLFRGLPVVSLLVLAVGLVREALKWQGRPAAPPPPAQLGGAWGLACEALFFPSLLQSDPWAWLGAWPLHVSLLLVVVSHLRFFLYPVPGWLVAFQPVGGPAGCALLLALGYLLARRLAASRLSLTSAFSDYFALVLLLAVAGTGVMMRRVSRPDVIDIKDMALGLAGRDGGASLPGGLLFGAHFLLANVLILYLPFSKLLHAPGLILAQGECPPRPRRIGLQDFPVPQAFKPGDGGG